METSERKDKKEFFEKYSSNTLAGSGNQSVFCPKSQDGLNVGRVFFKIYHGGRYNYSFLFTNIIDSTYSDGNISCCNFVCDDFYIEYIRVGVCRECSPDHMPDVALVNVTLNVANSRQLSSGEFFFTDETELDAQTGEYICVEIAFRGRTVPYHPESVLPAFVLSDGEWIVSTNLPFPSMIGCDRNVGLRIAYLGDSITQGIGVPYNSYKHWNALLSDMLSFDNAYWNLGLGYARASDAASDGAWLFKAKQNDLVIVCLGVNDILMGRSAEEIIKDLSLICKNLKQVGIKTVFQTIPPFDYSERQKEVFFAVNEYIRKEISRQCPVFDNVPYLCDALRGEHTAKYCSHPNEEGSRVWAEAFFRFLNNIL